MTAPHTADLAALHAHLDTHPDDWTARLVLADLLTDLGDEQGAACQRWMVEHRKCSRYWWAGNRWAWRNVAAADPLTSLSQHIVDIIPTGGEVDGGVDKGIMHYRTRQSAEAALLAALVAAGEI